METFNFIQWTDLKSESRGGRNRLGDYEISCYKNLTPKKTSNCGNYVSMSLFLTDVYSSDTHVRVGHMNSKVVFQFNKQDGLNITKKNVINKIKDNTSISRVVSKQFVDIIYKAFNLNPDRNSYRFKIIDLGKNTFMIDSIVK